MKMKKVMLITLILFFVFSVNVYAVSNIRTYTISTEEDNISTEKLVNGTTKQYSKPSPVYDFFDENGMLNVVYTSEANV